MQPSQSDINQKKVYFGNLPFSVSQDDLAQLVADFGPTTEVTLITDKMTGRSKGFGFVEFETEEVAQAAIEALNNQEVDGREIFVKVARPKQPRDDRFGGGRRDFGGGGGGRDFGGGGGGGNDRREFSHRRR